MRISDWSSDVCSSDLCHRNEADCRNKAGHDDRTHLLRHALPDCLNQRQPMLLTFTNGRHHDQTVQNRNTGQHDKPDRCRDGKVDTGRSEEHTSELQSLMRISYAVFCLKKKKNTNQYTKQTHMRVDVRYRRSTKKK